MALIARRRLLVGSATAALCTAFITLANRRSARATSPWGALIPDPEGLLDLPAGFTYALLETAGDAMDDGYRVPARPDGMACFAGPGDTLILMRNHENDTAVASGPYHSGQPVAPEAYDPAGMGGVTRLVVDANTLERISSNLVLAGTYRNCAGGPSPWGWLSCEETTVIVGDGDQERRHGYTFLCATDADSVRAPVPIPSYGRCRHEAAAVDPSDARAYLTEDRFDSCLYRFVPADPSDPFRGQLQALKVVGEDNFDTAPMADGEIVEIEWVAVDDPDPDADTLRAQAQAKGAAIFARGEGIWFFEGQVYITATYGGPLGAGQVFRLVDCERPFLESIVSVRDTEVLDQPDNVTVSPWGDVYVAEDNGSVNYIRFIDRSGEICTLARNAGSSSEFAGVCFSPRGDALFVNIQEQGLTLVITGPFADHASSDPGEVDLDAGGCAVVGGEA